jgi:hypothetical protein
MKTEFMIPDPESVDLTVKQNSGADPVSMRQGYKVLDGGPERIRDKNLPSSPALAETDNGGFLGRDESVTSESSKL